LIFKWIHKFLATLVLNKPFYLIWFFSSSSTLIGFLKNWVRVGMGCSSTLLRVILTQATVSGCYGRAWENQYSCHRSDQLGYILWSFKYLNFFILPSSDTIHKHALDVWFSLQKILLGLERILWLMIWFCPNPKSEPGYTRHGFEILAAKIVCLFLVSSHVSCKNSLFRFQVVPHGLGSYGNKWCSYDIVSILSNK
jgi:hypothetical protein